jgi:hypothetical protein
LRAQKQFSASAGLSGVVGYASAILVKVLAGGAMVVLAGTFALLKARWRCPFHSRRFVRSPARACAPQRCAPAAHRRRRRRAAPQPRGSTRCAHARPRAQRARQHLPLTACISLLTAISADRTHALPRARAQWMEIQGFVVVNWKNIEAFLHKQSKMLVRRGAAVQRARAERPSRALSRSFGCASRRCRGAGPERRRQAGRAGRQARAGAFASAAKRSEPALTLTHDA